MKTKKYSFSDTPKWVIEQLIGDMNCIGVTAEVTCPKLSELSNSGVLTLTAPSESKLREAMTDITASQLYINHFKPASDHA